MGKGGKPKVEVNLYFMSIHFGICAGADAIKRIVIKEKEAWRGYVTSQGQISISKPDLFGGKKKEGGVEGVVHWLPGLDTQVLADSLATRLGRSDGADAPGYRGLASAFFVGSGAGGSGSTGTGSGFFESLVKSASGGGAGFYWTANQPYLPGTWIEVERAAKGLDASIAMILRPGSETHPYESYDGLNSLLNSSIDPSGTVLISTDSFGVGDHVQVWDLQSRSLISANDLPMTINGNDFGVADELTFYATSSGTSLWQLGTDGSGMELTTDFDAGFVGACQYAGGVICILPAIGAGYSYYNGARCPEVATSFGPTCFFEDVDGQAWAIGPVGGSSGDIGIAQVPDGSETIIHTGYDGDVAALDNGQGKFFVYQTDGFVFMVDKETLTIDDTIASFAGEDGPDLRRHFNAVRPGAGSIWIKFTQHDTGTGALLRTINPLDWKAASSTRTIYDRLNNAIISQEPFTDTNITWRFLDRGERDANPAHIIYECLANTDWGMGSPTSLIDLDSFDDAAQALYDEPLGLSMIWTRQASIQDFIQEVLDHIQAVLFVDPQTGLLTIKLIRDDYDPDDLETIDPSTATLTNFGRKLWGEIVNEITVTWTNPENEQDETVTAHDLASITTQGGIVSDSRNYYGVRSPTVAARLAARDLRSAGAPLASCDAEVDRTQWALRPASVLKVTWPEYGLSGVVMRVVSIDYGKPGEPTLKLNLIEDVFGLDAGDYIEPPTTSWEDPSAAPTALEHDAVFTMPLFFAANSTVAAFVDSPEYPEVLAGVLGTTSDTDTFSWELWDELPLPDGTPEWTNLQTNSLAGYAELTVTLDAEVETTFETTDFDNAMGQTGPSAGGFVLIGDGTEETSEIALVTAAGTSFTVSRGVLDTVPRAWPIGTPVWFLDASSLFEDPQIRSAGEEVSYKFRTRTSQGLLSLAAAPLVEYELTERPWLPNRPANVEIDGVMFNTAATPVDMIGESVVPVTWANRNRLTEDSQVLGWTDTTVTPEVDQTTTIRVMTTDDVTMVGEEDGLTGTSHDVPVSAFGGEPIALIKPYATRIDDDGTFDSLQAHGIFVQVAPVRATEPGDIRVTEDGKIRVMEG